MKRRPSKRAVIAAASTACRDVETVADEIERVIEQHSIRISGAAKTDLLAAIFRLRGINALLQREIDIDGSVRLMGQLFGATTLSLALGAGVLQGVGVPIGQEAMRLISETARSVTEASSTADHHFTVLGPFTVQSTSLQSGRAYNRHSEHVTVRRFEVVLGGMQPDDVTQLREELPDARVSLATTGSQETLKVTGVSRDDNGRTAVYLPGSARNALPPEGATVFLEVQGSSDEPESMSSDVGYNLQFWRPDS